MREVLNDKQDMKSLILDRVDEQLAAEVCVLCLASITAKTHRSFNVV